MSSRGSYSGLRSGADSSTPTGSSTNVVYEQVRSTKAEDYKADVFHRGSRDRNVSVINHHSSGYEANAPHPSYHIAYSRNDHSGNRQS
ncbi:hypothetical protein F5Y05DRAFT_413630 [Hypoxylon sp. FL0543]|nr:hypothetical protein F5Y05DRAFT_413630 [Hypoxylon sp. FL0543]